MKYILESLTQPSTWKGILGLVTAFGIVLEPQQATAIITAGLAVIAMVNIFISEN